jgi:hypothetical protein
MLVRLENGATLDMPGPHDCRCRRITDYLSGDFPSIAKSTENSPSGSKLHRPTRQLIRDVLLEIDRTDVTDDEKIKLLNSVLATLSPDRWRDFFECWRTLGQPRISRISALRIPDMFNLLLERRHYRTKHDFKNCLVRVTHEFSPLVEDFGWRIYPLRVRTTKGPRRTDRNDVFTVSPGNPYTPKVPAYPWRRSTGRLRSSQRPALRVKCFHAC